MAKFQTVGIENAIAELKQQGENWQKSAGRAVFEGARVAADEVRQQINKIPRRKRLDKDTVMGLMPDQIRGLQDSLGIARARNTSDDEVNVLIGFDGYNDRGQPNSMIARSLQAGTYFLQKYPFMTYAINASKSRAEQAMAAAFEQSFTEENK